jgi:DNA polymerase-1
MVPLIARYREISKLASTYVDALPALVRSDTGRLHTTFNQAVAATGRLSSSDPNLQNIPIRTQEGKRIREAFVPRDGWVLIGGDYSQIELRVLAHMCEDPVLTDAFASGEDIHSRTAAEVLEIPVADVSGTQRAAAKAINFGLIYGMGAVRLARETGLTRTEAKQYIERYFDRISRVKPFMDELVELARSRGYAETLVGRRRPIPELVFAESRRAYALGERLARNTPIQGTAADIIKIAMINVERRLATDGLGAEMLLTVHDELLFECPPDEVEDSCSAIREEMEAAFPLSVPLLVEFHSGATWAELK